MFLSQLSLLNFRNFKKREFEFSPRLTIIVGPNTSGKTNILEAIYMLTTGKSFRAELEKEVISYGEEITRVGAEVSQEQNKARIPHFRGGVRPDQSREALVGSSASLFENPLKGHQTLKGRSSGFSEHSEMGIARLNRVDQNSEKLETVITTGQVGGKNVPKKQFLVNGVKKRLTDFVGNFYAVLFSPEDLQIVTNSPSLRRKYLDNVLSCVDKEYRRALLIYEKALRQRNRILEKIREKRAGFAQLEYWDKLLMENGKVISEKREEFIKFINNQFRSLRSVEVQECTKNSRPLNFGTTETLGNFKVVYEKNEINQEKLRKNQAKEIYFGMTLVGPHRDDFVVKLKAQMSKVKATTQSLKLKEGRNISVYGSRGEQRLGVLWLKLCELAFLEEKTGVKPVLLLDDIFSELDQDHRDLVAKIIPNQQTIITTTDEGSLGKEFLNKAKVIKLEI